MKPVAMLPGPSAVDVAPCRLAFLVIILFGQTAFAQKFNPLLQPLSFLSGQWVSDSADEIQEESWSQPIGNSMVGTFRVIHANDAVFYELWAIEVENGQAIFKMKHFNRGLIGWEEKDDVVRLVLSVKGREDIIFANQDGSLSLAYKRKGDDLTGTLRRVKNGETKEDTFHFIRRK